MSRRTFLLVSAVSARPPYSLCCLLVPMHALSMCRICASVELARLQALLLTVRTVQCHRTVAFV